MFNTHSVQRLLLATTLLLSAAIPVAVHADDDATASGPHLSATDRPIQTGRFPPRPGSWEAIMSVKDPSHFGPHLPAADTPSSYVPPVPGSIAAVMSTKDPAHYGPHLAAADQPIQTGRFPPRPGSFEAIILAKDPMFFKRGRAAENPK